MVRVTIFEQSGIVTGFKCSGHAGFGEYGQDIVCAAVSVLTINTVNSVSALTDEKFSFESDDKKGVMEFKFVNTPGEKGQLLLKSLKLGLESIESNYGHEFVKLSIREV